MYILSHGLPPPNGCQICSTLRHQYPVPVKGYEPDWFAEKMLPEGAHNQEEDFTYFILYPHGPTVDDEVSIYLTQHH